MEGREYEVPFCGVYDVYEYDDDDEDMVVVGDVVLLVALGELVLDMKGVWYGVKCLCCLSCLGRDIFI